jgi:hypothetical protein
LRLDFDGGDAIVVPPDPDYEAWEVSGPGRVKVVALPGGGEPAISDSTSEFRRTKGRTQSFELGPPRDEG